MVTEQEILRQILEIIKPMAPENGPPVTAELDLVNDLGLDSIKVMEILETLEDSFDISIPINILPGVRTVKDLAYEIHNLTGNEL
ncbi:MAG: acyl carrier protein [Desulfobulbaceae bacterium]|nr:acyl carrier protein [Desulfobulbaceae bacterium]